jgi:aminomethyltransferase
MNAHKRTVLYALHLKLGARMTVFGGFEMPVSYSGIIEEHLSVRTGAGIFDLSHMGEFEISGPRALPLLERALSNSAARLKEGQAQYTIMCADDGGTIDDLIVYRLGAERFMLCVNASNIDVDREWLLDLNNGREHFNADFRDLSDATSLVAVQGPDAVAILGRIAEFPIAKVPRFAFAEGLVAGVACIAARTGYTGEDGFELFVENAGARRLFDAILEAGAKSGIKPVGLGARDTLRLEAGLPLYGHELDRATTPLEAGLSPFVKMGRDFVGSRAIETEPRKRLIGLMTDDGKNLARQGYPIFHAGREAGVVTSGTFSPSLRRPIAMAYFSGPRAPAIGSTIEVEIRNRKVPATVTAKPFYRRDALRAA